MPDIYQPPIISHDEWLKIINETSNESDRSMAIVCSALLELTIERCILHRLLPMSPKEHEGLFKGVAPLATFSAKIRLGYALGLFGPESKKAITKIKDIRNEFAHKFIRDFGQPEIVSLCQHLPLHQSSDFGVTAPSDGDTGRHQMRLRYHAAVWHFVTSIPREARVIQPPPKPRALP